ncbi:NAD(P)-dependent alcohol dehydrogenase [Marimonas arenosa]|uniref:NAD(P)-dependent alcohol dehydrogenase n=1 Tax=Marimonas arenosa TaxID=1795305 RepID=A0AAE3WFN3_9RHOB|nr:NAD(P)-dependent alcohol dehydrogenase [Marimonas arenosa]MDQ2092156.1 NAD(P)-dependent alcohol dehydrogenase [Marimonas arenosa]
MKAVICDRYGPPESLHLADVSVPDPGAGEVLVRVHCSTVNRTDTATLRGHPFFARAMTGWWRPRHRITGMDFAGVVERCGAGVERFAPGNRVFGMSPERFGAHAEFICVPQNGAVAVIPDPVPMDEAVICEGAWYASSTVKRLARGQSILIYGASGAIGTAAVQLARARGAHVTAVVGPRHLSLARDLGAGQVLDYTVEDFTAIGETFDVVMDAVGHTSYFACRSLLKPGGLYCATDLGPVWSNIWLAALRGGRVGVPFPTDAPGFVQDLAGLMQSGQVKGVFDRRFAVDDVIEAFRFVETGHKTGIVRLDLAA